MAYITGFDASNVHIDTKLGRGQETHKERRIHTKLHFTASYYKVLFTATPFYKTISVKKE